MSGLDSDDNLSYMSLHHGRHSILFVSEILLFHLGLGQNMGVMVSLSCFKDFAMTQ